MPADRRIIVALDLPDAGAARDLVARLGTAANFYKVGLELFAAGDGMALATELRRAGHDVFVDLKLLDIPATVSRAAARVAAAGARYLTVHADAGAMRAAVAGTQETPTQVLAVTVLTSHDPGPGGAAAVTDLVVSRARLAVDCGCAGVVCAPTEAAAVRAALGAGPRIVTPGIRAGGEAKGDQARTASASAALLAGADHVVVGRPVRDARDPQATLRALVASLPVT